MRKEVFHTTLIGESNTKTDLRDMEVLIDRYPYSDVVWAAYIQFLRSTEDHRLESVIDRAAVHVSNRKMIHGLLQADVVKLETEIVKDPTVELEKLAPQEERDTAEKVKQDTPDLLSKQYMTAAVQSSIILEVGEGSIQEAAEELGSAEQVREEIVPSSFLDFIGGEEPAKKSVPKQDQALIARFLNNEKREKVAFFDPARMAQKSLEDKGGVVSDTLARIFVSQGNYSKALAAYEQLILKYPEKSGYFAARIEKVKALIREKKK